jgi:hypothetical protein
MLSIFIMIYGNEKQNYDPINFETLKDDVFDWVLGGFTTILNYNEELEALCNDLSIKTIQPISNGNGM